MHSEELRCQPPRTNVSASKADIISFVHCNKNVCYSFRRFFLEEKVDSVLMHRVDIQSPAANNV